MKCFNLICVAFLMGFGPNVTKAQTILKATDLQADFAIVRKAYEQMHPGLYKYADKATIDRAFEACKAALNHDQPLAEAYLNLHKLTAAFKCGHAYPNFYNQEAFLKSELFEQKNALPFHFRLIDGRMLVTKSADVRLKDGVEVKSINGIRVEKIIKTLLPIVRADGSNNGKRLKLLEISGQNFEYFDIFYPLFFPPKSVMIELKLYDLATQKSFKCSVMALNHADRDKAIIAAYKNSEYVKTAFGWLDDETALMTINDFQNYDGKYNFGKFYGDALREYQTKNGKNLIIDVRKNEGGNGDEVLKLVRLLIEKPIEYTDNQNTWAMLKIDSTLKPYVDNKKWAFVWFNQSEKNYNRLPNGQWQGKGSGKPVLINPEKQRFTGNIYLLISPTNSSATFGMAELFKTHRLATLVGQTTGGNQKGVTAGALFFMLLPHTKIEVDVPLIGTDLEIAKKLPDAGIAPDIYVKQSIKDAANGEDTEIREVKKIIAAKK